jgi:transposase
LTKSAREIMEILESFDLTRCHWSAGHLAGCDPKTVARYVARRDAGADPHVHARRSRIIDPFLEKIEELVERSNAVVRADKIHERLLALGFAGDERTTRRAVAEAKASYAAGHRRRYRPWVPEPGMWLQFDWGEGPRIAGRRTNLFCAWVAWSRFRVVIPTWDRTLGTLVACLDATLRRVGGAPTYLLTDNEKTVTVEHVAGVAVRHPEMVAAGRHYGCKVETCVPYDPESKGGSESTVKVAKRDIVPTEATQLAGNAYSSCPRAAIISAGRPAMTPSTPSPSQSRYTRACSSSARAAQTHTSRPSAWARSTTSRLSTGRSPHVGGIWMRE